MLQEEIDALVDDGFHFEATDMRVTFSAGADAWALKFAAPAAFEGFLQRYNKASFENRFGLEQNDEGEAKVRRCRWLLQRLAAGRACCRRVCTPRPGATAGPSHRPCLLQSCPRPAQIFGDFAGMRMGVEGAESRKLWVEDMDVDGEPDPRVRRGRWRCWWGGGLRCDVGCMRQAVLPPHLPQCLPHRLPALFPFPAHMCRSCGRRVARAAGVRSRPRCRPSTAW